MPLLSLTQITFVDIVIVEGRISFFSWNDDQAVAREAHAVWCTVRWPRFARARIATVGHVPEMFCACFLSIPAAFELHVAICRGLEPASVTRGVVVHDYELV